MFREYLAQERRRIAEAFRTRPWLKWVIVAVVSCGSVAAYSVVTRGPTVPPKLCECPLAKEPPKQGKKQGEVKSAPTKGEKR